MWRCGWRKQKRPRDRETGRQGEEQLLISLSPYLLVSLLHWWPQRRPKLGRDLLDRAQRHQNVRDLLGRQRVEQLDRDRRDEIDHALAQAADRRLRQCGWCERRVANT